MSNFNFRISIEPEAIEVENGKTYAKTAIVEKWQLGNRVASARYGFLESEEIYQAIDKEEKIDLSYCYISDFSLSQYRKSRQLKESDVIDLHTFEAEHAFFDSEFGTDLSYSHFIGKNASFAYSKFNGGKINFGHAKCETNLNFNHAEFYVEEVSFRFAMFDKGNVRFSFCYFDCKDLLFVNTIFGAGSVNFRQANFRKSNCNFQYAQFKNGDVSFDKAIFRGDHIDFRKIEFGSGKVDFRRADFGNGGLSFDDCEFEGAKVNFRSAKFGNGEKSFKNAIFSNSQLFFDGSIFGEGLCTFKGAELDLLSLNDTRLNGHLDLRISKGNEIDLSSSIIRDIIDLQADDKPVELNTLKIEGIKNMGKIFLSWDSNRVYQLITSQKNSSLESKAQQFNLLKENFHSNGQYNSEDHSYVAFKRFEMKADLEHGNKLGGMHSFGAKLNYAFKWLIFDKAGKFATDPVRVLLSMIIILSFFSLLYMILPVISQAGILAGVDDPDHLGAIGKSFYHSAITFFTIGYGDHYPVGHIRWLSAVEGWTGVFLMSYFTVAFVRKILR